MIIFVVHAEERRGKQALLKRLYLAHHLHHPVALNAMLRWLEGILLDTLGNFGVVLNFHHAEVQEMHKPFLKIKNSATLPS